MSLGNFFKNIGIGAAAGLAMGAGFGLMSRMSPFGGFWGGFGIMPSIWGFGGFFGGGCCPPPHHHHHHCNFWC